MAKSGYNEYKSMEYIEIKDSEFEFLRKFVYQQIGINLTEEKRTLLTGRLQKILRKLKFRSFENYIKYVVDDRSGMALSELANTISTNHTFFGREADHFDFFSTVALKEIRNRCENTGDYDIRIWDAGCSSGEEPYTLVMLMMDFFGQEYAKYDAGILATDISENALNIAKAGIYPPERLKNFDQKYVKKYFKKLPDGSFEVIPKVKKEVLYRRFNLMNKTFPFKQKFDVIFCRNVMIYFDAPTREALVNKFYNLTKPGGYLFIGHSETLNRDTMKYKFVQPALYKRIK